MAANASPAGMCENNFLLSFAVCFNLTTRHSREHRHHQGRPNGAVKMKLQTHNNNTMKLKLRESFVQ